MSQRFSIACSLVPALAAAIGCTGAAAPPDDASDDARSDDFTPSATSCPVDPDDFSSQPECPDYWVCEDIPNGKRCYTPGADQPDDGDWECWDDGGSTYCRGDGFPDGGADGNWTCESTGDLVVCEDDVPAFPDVAGAGAWDCFHSGEFRVCDSGGASTDSGGMSSGDSGTGESGGGEPFSGVCKTYYAAKWDGGGLACQDVSNGNGVFCLETSAAGLENGCGMGAVRRAGDNAVVTLPSNCQLIEASSKCANTCEGALSNATGNGITFTSCPMGDGDGSFAISHTEAVWCCS